jgi:hypothetical protein
MNAIQLSPEVKALLGSALPMKSRVLLSLNAKADRTGSPVFAGVGQAEKDRRRAKGRVAKASRKRNRVS